MRVLVAVDKFKGSLSAHEAAVHVEAGLRSVAADLQVVEVPVADGGDGTVDAAIAAGFDAVTVTATGPTGAPVTARYARRGTTAVIELATICGLVRLPEGRPDPLGATSTGVGEVIRAALDAGARRIVLGVGGSASTDAGAGMLSALGASIDDFATLDLTGLHPAVAACEFVVACDVDNPLTGPSGAAYVYGPQKGADPAQVAVLDARLRRFADAVTSSTGFDLAGVPGVGAAGGVAYAAHAVLGARLQPGIELILDLVGFADLFPADLVITGEGRLDEQTLAGKAPVGVATAAGRAGVTTVAVAGRITLTPEQLASAGIAAAYSLTDIEPDPAQCIANAAQLLEQVAATVATEWLGANLTSSSS